MGSMGALGMAAAVEEGQVSLQHALRWHLASNHFPPVSQDFVPTCENAIELANNDDWDMMLLMPNGIAKSVGDIIDGLHLHAFVSYEEEI